MEKKVITKIRVMLAVVLALALCLGSISSVFAASSDPAVATSTAAITKLLKVPYGTTVPAVEFTFEVELKNVDGDTAPATLATVPAVGTAGIVTIDFPAVTPTPGYDYYKVDSGIEYYYLESVELFGGIAWPNAGVYEYLITETSHDYVVNPTPPPTETLTKSLAEYTVYVYVDECTGFVDPAKTIPCTDHSVGDLFITHIGVLMIVDDGGITIPDIDQEKADPTPGGDSGGSSTPTYYTSQMIFTNEYWKTTGPTGPNDGTYTLAVSKEVDGNNASTTRYFTFNMTIKAPALTGVATTYKAYVVEEDTAGPDPYKIVTDANNYAGTIGGDGSITFTSGSALIFMLKHGQSLFFIDTPVGTSYILSETGVAGYTPKVTVVYDSSTSVADTTSAASGASYALPSTAIPAINLYVSEDGSSAAFLNDRGATSPTGLDISDLPFIGLIVVAIGAIAAWILVKSRKRKQYNRG